MAIGTRANCLPLLVLVIAVNFAFGFLSLEHVARAPFSRVPGPDTQRCSVHGTSTFRRKSGSWEISMGVDPKELRLRAAQLGSRLKGTNLYFVGMMGTGKSTIARSLSSVMGRYRFLDTDAVIEEALGAPIEKLFDTEGEEAFRTFESLVLDKMHCYAKKCISTGGGIVTIPQNWGKLHTGIVVWLDMEPKDIFERLMKDPGQVDKRPLLSGDDPLGKLEALMADRRSQYELADVRVPLEPHQDVEDATLAVIDNVVGFIDSNPPKWQEWKDKAQDNGIDWA